MIQDPTRLASLLADLRKITGDRATAIVVVDGIARAATIGINNSTGVRFYACSDSFTRSIAEAHDQGRKFSSKGGNGNGESVEAKPAQTGIESANKSGTDAAGNSQQDPAASLIANLSALKSTLGPDISAIAAMLLDESAALATEVVVSQQMPPMIEVKAIIGVARAMSDLEPKLADALAACRRGDSPEPMLESAIAIAKAIEDSIFGDAP